jgi:hypothetical protein
MKGFLTGFPQIIKLLIALIFIVALPLSMTALNTGKVVFNPVVVKRVLTETITGSDLIPSTLAWVSELRAKERDATNTAIPWNDEPNALDLIEFIGVEDWRRITSGLITDEIRLDWITASVDGFFEWLDSDIPLSNIVWDLTTLKGRINSQHGVEALSIAYEALPPCKESQIKEFKDRLISVPAGSNVFYTLCKFPDPWGEDQFSEYTRSLGDLVTFMPPSWNPTDAFSPGPDSQGVKADAAKKQFLQARWQMKMAPVIPVILLLLIMLSVGYSLKSLGFWWGIPITTGAIIGLIINLTHRRPITQYLSNNLMRGVPLLIRPVIYEISLRTAAQIFRPMLWQSLVILVMGLAMILVGSLGRANQDRRDLVLKKPQKPK